MAYSTVDELKGMQGVDQAIHSDAEITTAITLADEDIDRYTWTSFEYKAFSVTVSGNNARSIQVVDDEGRPILYLRTLTSVTIDTGSGAEAQTTTNWKLYPEGVIIRDTGVFGCLSEGRNVVIAGTAGYSSTPPEGVKWSSRRLARYELLREDSRISDRALNINNDFGTIALAQPGGSIDRPTALPEVNARLARYKQMSLPVG